MGKKNWFRGSMQPPNPVTEPSKSQVLVLFGLSKSWEQPADGSVDTECEATAVHAVSCLSGGGAKQRSQGRLKKVMGICPRIVIKGTHKSVTMTNPPSVKLCKFQYSRKNTEEVLWYFLIPFCTYNYHSYSHLLLVVRAFNSMKTHFPYKQTSVSILHWLNSCWI